MYSKLNRSFAYDAVASEGCPSCDFSLLLSSPSMTSIFSDLVVSPSWLLLNSSVKGFSFEFKRSMSCYIKHNHDRS